MYAYTMYVHVCMYVCTYVRTYVRMYVCMYVCMYVRMYVHMHINICVLHTETGRSGSEACSLRLVQLRLRHCEGSLQQLS